MNRIRTRLATFGFVAACALAATFAASPPDRINYQGVLRDLAGNPENGAREMTFRFWSTDGGGCPASGGTLLLTDAHTAGSAVTVDSGMFNVLLGSGTLTPGSEADLAEVFRDHAAVYLEVEVAGDVLCPRTAIASSPYALNAGKLAGQDASAYLDTSSAFQSKAGALAVGGNLTVSGTLTGNGSGLSNLDAGNVTSGVLPAARGGTGLSAVGGAGTFLRSNGAALSWSAIQPSDLPGGSSSYLGRNTADTSTVSAPGYIYDLTNSSTASGANGLRVRLPIASAVAGGNRYGIDVETAVDDGTADGSFSINHGARAYAHGAATAAGQQVANYGLRGTAGDSRSVAGQTDNRGVLGEAQGGGTATNYGVYGTSIGTTSGPSYGLYGTAWNSSTQNYGVAGVANLATAGTNYGVYGQASGATTANWAGYFAGNVNATGSVTVGTNLLFGGGGVLESGPTYNWLRGDADTDSLYLYAGNTVDDGGLFVPGDSTFTLYSGNGSFSFRNGAAGSVETAGLDGSGNLQIDGDLTVSGSDITLGGGGILTGTASYNWLRGDADTDDLYLYAGDGTDDGALWIAGDSSFTLYSGSGFFSFRNGASGSVQTASLSDLGGLNINGNLTIGSADTAGNDAITFDGVEALTWDETDGRLEWSDDLQLAGVLRAATSTVDFYNTFGTITPLSADLTATCDVGVACDLEVASQIYVSDIENRDQAATGAGTRLLTLGSTQSLVFMMDEDNNSASADVFEWFHNGSTATASKLAELEPSGDLEIAGTLFTNFAFDVAEMFLAGEALEPGDVVSIDPARASAVLRSSGEHDRTVIGVASTEPAVVLGGTIFGVEGLEAWGTDVRDEFLREEAALIEASVASAPELATLHSELQSLRASIEASVATASEAGGALERGAASPADGEGPPALEATARAEELRDALRSAVLERFVARRFVPVTLSGRVPVKVDGSYGEIAPGDLLAPSPVPGVAMKASRPGPIIGTALESFTGSRGRVLAFIHRGHYTPAEGIEAAQRDLGDAIADRTPDPATGIQSVPGHLQVVLDRGGDDDARFSIFRDGDEAGSLGAEVFRVDEAGNVYARGSFRPSSMDVAEYFPLGESAEPGDVLVADRASPGRYVPARDAADPAVVGVVAEDPGVLLGSWVSRIAAADTALARELTLARESGDREAEARAWSGLEAAFRRTHAPLALTGTVRVKVDAGYGAIAVGDLLTTSPTAGHAMRADDPRPGTILGKALEPLDAGTGKVLVLVMLR